MPQLSSGSIVIFLASTTTTLESQLPQLQSESIEHKIQIAKNLIVFLQEAHVKNILGFDLRPSSILFNLSYKDFSLSFIGFVGNSKFLQSHPDASKLMWDSKFVPPELQLKTLLKPKKVAKSKIKHKIKPLYPTKASDVYGIGMVLQMILGKTNETDLMLIEALDRLPENRKSMKELYDQFSQYLKPILKQLSPDSPSTNLSLNDSPKYVKLIEDLFEIEWLSVKNAPCDKTGMIKISEGRIIKPLNGTQDYLSEEDRFDEII
jgi:serine/threonine protein kinase